MPIPSINNFENREVSQSTKIYDRTGNVVLYDAHGAEERTSVPLAQISPYIQEATVAIEDSTFYTNAGIRPLSSLRALWVDLTTGSYQQGGSTITQQVVKNALLTQDKTITRKIEEVILALRLTKAYSKDQILNTYLNESPYGGTIYGVQAAAQYFFGVDASKVDLAQAAYLAALPQAPTYLSPYGDNRAALDARKNLVLAQMKAQGYITADEYNQAVAENGAVQDRRAKAGSRRRTSSSISSSISSRNTASTRSTTAASRSSRRSITTSSSTRRTCHRPMRPASEANFNASNTGLVAVDPEDRPDPRDGRLGGLFQ